MPALVRALRDAAGEPHVAFVHKGATRRDAVDTGLMVRMRAVLAVLDERLAALAQGLPVQFGGPVGNGEKLRAVR